MIRRPGMSLTEVLVALFILTLGVIGILTMFPLGAAQMAYAVRDDRSALAATNADGYMRWYWQTNVVTGAETNFQPPGAPSTPGSLGGLFDNPAQLGVLPFTNLLPLAQVNPQGVNYPTNQMSYPIIVDPMGSIPRPTFFGDAPTTGAASIPRVSLSVFNPALPNVNAQVFRTCSLIDTLGYGNNGAPNRDLEMRYNWMWVLQRPQVVNQTTITNAQNYTAPNMNLFTVNMTVVVFDRRPPSYPPSSVKGFEVVIPATLTSGSTSVTLNLSSVQQAQDIKPGMWVMDASIIPAQSIRQANFYRVVSVTQINATQVNLELQTPISAPTGYAPVGFSYPGTLVALKGVSGVFVRPPLTWSGN